MATHPQSDVTEVKEMAAALVLVGGATSEGELETTMVLTWYVEDGLPFVSADEAMDALECTEDLIEEIEAKPEYVPAGFTSDRWSFFYDALVDGAKAIREALPALEELDDAAADFDEMFGSAVIDGVVSIPEPGLEEPIKLD